LHLGRIRAVSRSQKMKSHVLEQLIARISSVVQLALQAGAARDQRLQTGQRRQMARPVRSDEQTQRDRAAAIIACACSPHNR